MVQVDTICLHRQVSYCFVFIYYLTVHLTVSFFYSCIFFYSFYNFNNCKQPIAASVSFTVTIILAWFRNIFFNALIPCLYYSESFFFASAIGKAAPKCLRGHVGTTVCLHGKLSTKNPSLGFSRESTYSQRYFDEE